MSTLSTLASSVGAVPGAALAAALSTTARLRNNKPLHPVGRVGAGVLSVTDPQPDLGVPLLELPTRHECLVRWSRAMGLPEALPDFEGLAIRFSDPTADLLFASTGTGSVTRFLLVPRPAGRHGPQTTLLPVSTGGGPLVFRLTPVGAGGDEPPNRFYLAVARGASGWQTVGTLDVPTWGEDRPTRFDPVRNVLPGTEQYPLVRWLREPSYLGARRSASART